MLCGAGYYFGEGLALLCLNKYMAALLPSGTPPEICGQAAQGLVRAFAGTEQQCPENAREGGLVRVETILSVDAEALGEDVLERLCTLLHAAPVLRQNCLAQTPFPTSVLHGIVREVLQQERVPFEAEPLTGLQVLGMPGRALGNEFITASREGKKKPFKCVFHCVHTCEQEKTPYCIAQALINAMRGNLERGFAFCGANVARVNKIISVRELMDSLQKEFDDAMNSLSKSMLNMQNMLNRKA